MFVINFSDLISKIGNKMKHSFLHYLIKRIKYRKITLMEQDDTMEIKLKFQIQSFNYVQMSF